jgi:hypothetical protein
VRVYKINWDAAVEKPLRALKMIGGSISNKSGYFSHSKYTFFFFILTTSFSLHTLMRHLF